MEAGRNDRSSESVHFARERGQTGYPELCARELRVQGLLMTIGALGRKLSVYDIKMQIKRWFSGARQGCGLTSTESFSSSWSKKVYSDLYSLIPAQRHLNPRGRVSTPKSKSPPLSLMKRIQPAGDERNARHLPWQGSGVKCACFCDSTRDFLSVRRLKKWKGRCFNSDSGHLGGV